MLGFCLIFIASTDYKEVYYFNNKNVPSYDRVSVAELTSIRQSVCANISITCEHIYKVVHLGILYGPKGYVIIA